MVESSEKVGIATFLIGTGAIIPGLDKKLMGLETGTQTELSFEPEEAFGTTDSAPTREMPKSDFPDADSLKNGDTFEAGIQASTDQKVKLIVQGTSGDAVTVKIVHPLANRKSASRWTFKCAAGDG